MMPEVKITNRDRDGHQPESTPTGYRLGAEELWIVEGPDSALKEIEAALPRVRWVGSVLTIRFTNAVGLFEVPHLGRLEVRSRKWSEKHFDAMLSEISERLAALPFAAGTRGHVPYDRSLADDNQILLHTFIYLRHICSLGAAPDEQVLPALRVVTRAPHRRLERTHRWTDIGAARRIGPRGLVRMLAPQAGLQRVATPTSNELVAAFHGNLPQRVEETQTKFNVDVPENRFVKLFLDQMLGIVERVRALKIERKKDFLRKRLDEECDEIERLIAPVRQHALWGEVRQMHRLPVDSVVLQRRRGYRELFRLYLRLRMTAHFPLSPKNIERLIEVKNIAVLYELWVFFRVERAVSKALGSEPTSVAQGRATDLHLSLKYDLRISWGAVEIFYNLRFTRTLDSRQSYSLPLRPDVVLRVPEGVNKGLHVFDAKFRLDQISKLEQASTEIDEDEESNEQRGKFKNADLYKMHTYRDALRQVKSVWIAFPGSEFGFFAASDQPKLIQQVGELGNEIDGVGAIPTKPGEDAATLDSIVAALLKSGS